MKSTYIESNRVYIEISKYIETSRAKYNNIISKDCQKNKLNNKHCSKEEILMVAMTTIALIFRIKVMIIITLSCFQQY